MVALPARQIIRWRGAVIAAWAALAVLFAPRALHIERSLSVRGSFQEQTESAHASRILREAFPSPFADYVAIVVHGPVRYTSPGFTAVLDSLSAAVARQPYVSQVVSAKALGDSTFVSSDHRTTFLIAALAPDRTADITKTFIPDLRDTVHAALDGVPDAVGFEVKVTGNPALDHDTRTISAEDTEHGEKMALPPTLIVLVLAFGALIAAMLPLEIGRAHV